MQIYTYIVCYENVFTIYGFKSEDELDMFNDLLKVSGVGCKTALSILNSKNLIDIKEALQKSNVSFFLKIANIGLKTAKNIINELGIKENEDFKVLKNSLEKIGYSKHEISYVIDKIDTSMTIDMQIKESVIKLGKLRNGKS